MPMPKSVTRINRNGVTYTSNVDACMYSIQELTRAALRDVAKFTRRNARDKIKPHNQPGKNLSKNIGTWVRKDKDGKLWLQLGVYNKAQAAKKGLDYAFYGQFFEFGTSKQPADPFIKPAVMDHIDKIKEIEGKYLSALSHEVMDNFDESEEIADD